MAVDPDMCDHSWSSNCFGLDMDGLCEQRMDKHETEEADKGKGLGFEEVNIVDLLPVDPFDMDIKSTVTATKGWFQEIEEDIAIDFDDFLINGIDEDMDDCGSFSGPEWFLNGSLRVQPQTTYFSFDDRSTFDDIFNAFKFPNPLWGYKEMESSAANQVVLGDEKKLEVEYDCDVHSALLLALNYLEVEDLIVVEGVCRSLRDAVRGDPLLWRSVKINQPLSLKITDDVLVRLTNRAQGSIASLSLVDCIKISDSGLSQVLRANPKLIKLSIPGCIRLTIDAIVRHLRYLKSNGTLKVKYLRIGGLGCVSESNFEELKVLLGAEKGVMLRPNKPQFFHLGPVYLSGDDNRPLDVEPCPFCGRIGLVFDCPIEACAGKNCRACTLCIPRCIECGCCIRDRNYEETFFFDFICLDCFKVLVGPEKAKVKSTTGQAFVCHEMTYQLCIYGD